MPDLLKTGSDWLADKLKAHASQPVIFRRGDDQVSVQATIGRKEFETDSGNGRLYIRSCDFLIHTADLAVNSQAVLPDRGDFIDATFDGETVTFEVLPDAGAPPWEFSDPYQKLLRIHTKRVAS